VKRAHLTNVRVGKAMLGSRVPGMTPARFDIMCFLRQTPISYGKEIARKMAGSAFQRSIVEQLALHPSTISKMLDSLERLGWITRERFLLNRRFKVIELTALGLRRVWEAMRFLWRQRPLLRSYEKIARGFFPDRHVLDGLDLLWNILDGLARAFDDASGISYDYGSRTIGADPDDPEAVPNADIGWRSELPTGHLVGLNPR
jgi:DNA-binding MarR family transcriptional regulator